MKLILKTKEPPINPILILSCRRVHYQGALSPACVDLSRLRNREVGVVWRTIRARPVARPGVVVAFAKGYVYCRRMTPGQNTRQSRAEYVSH